MKKKRYSKLNSLLIHFLCRKGGGKKKITKGKCKCQGEKGKNSQKKNIYIEVERFKKENNNFVTNRIRETEAQQPFCIVLERNSKQSQKYIYRFDATKFDLSKGLFAK